MQSIYEAETLLEFIQRIEKLTPGSKAQWGKMNVSQMLAHCCAPLEVAVGDTSPKSGLISRILGPMVKSSVTGPKPFKQNLPTDKTFLVTGNYDFNKEKARLIALVTRFSNAGSMAMGNRRHPFFGNLTPDEWSVLMVKHLDHHLRQFGA